MAEVRGVKFCERLEYMSPSLQLTNHP